MANDVDIKNDFILKFIIQVLSDIIQVFIMKILLNIIIDDKKKFTDIKWIYNVGFENYHYAMGYGLI